MAIIVSKDGKGAVKLNQTPFGLEDTIQQYIYDNPESIPLYDIRQDIQLLILAREFGTLSGPIDAIGIDREGELYLVETKLYKNPDKRTVVAQVLDYGASLWKAHPDFDSFLLQLNTSVQKNFQQTIRERIQSFFSLEEAVTEEIITNMGKNLEEGNFKFVVLMDTMHDRLKDLILYMNQNSKFDIYGVELEYYKHDEFEIIIPKLFGAEVKKDIASRKADNTFISNQEFISLYESIGLGDQIKELLSFEQQMQNNEISIHGWTARRTPKYINFSYNIPGKPSQSLTAGVGYAKGSTTNTFDLWLYDKTIEDKVLEAIQKHLGSTTTRLKPTAYYGLVTKWPLQDFSKEKLIAFFSALAQ